VPEALAPADGLEFWLSSLPPLHAAAAIIVLAAINAMAGRMILLIVFLSATAVRMITDA
jgi:hypothetical protein